LAWIYPTALSQSVAWGDNEETRFLEENGFLRCGKMKTFCPSIILLAIILLFTCVTAYSDVGFSGSAYNETSLINYDKAIRYGNRSALHLKAESLSKGVKLVSELEFYTMYGYLSSVTPEMSELLKDGMFYLDRLYLKFPVHNVDTVLGKQRIAWGSSIIFRPTDRFNKPNPLSLSGRKEGVNALSAKIYVRDLSALEFVVAPADAFERVDGEVNLEHLKYSKFASLFTTNFYKTDMALSYQYNGGPRNHILGLDMKGDLKLGYHLETIFIYNSDSFKAENLEDYWQSVLGLDYSFSFHGNWVLFSEYFYNGRGIKKETALSASSVSLLEEFKYRHYLYSQISYQHDIFLRGNLFLIWNLVDKSLIISPGINYSFFQNTDLQLYSQIFFGDETDEYGPARLGVGQVYYLKLTVKF